MANRSKTNHFKGFSIVDGNIRVKVDLKRFEKQYQKAQYELDNAVMTSMVPYMPMQTGTFINLTKVMSSALAGSGTVVAAAPPMGRYLYEGKVMVDSETGKGPRKIPTGDGGFVLRFNKGAKLIATDRPLNYNNKANPKATKLLSYAQFLQQAVP